MSDQSDPLEEALLEGTQEENTLGTHIAVAAIRLTREIHGGFEVMSVEDLEKAIHNARMLHGEVHLLMAEMDERLANKEEGIAGDRC